MSDRQTLISGYQQCPELLAIELEALFEPLANNEDAYAHNKAIERICLLCGEQEIGSSPVNDEPMPTGKLILKCKRKLADRLARTVLIYAQSPEGVQQ